MVVHELPLEQHNLDGYFSPDLEPVLELDPGAGDSVPAEQRDDAIRSQ